MQIDWLTDQVKSLISWASSASDNLHSDNLPKKGFQQQKSLNKFKAEKQYNELFEEEIAS